MSHVSAGASARKAQLDAIRPASGSAKRSRALARRIAATESLRPQDMHLVILELARLAARST